LGWLLVDDDDGRDVAGAVCVWYDEVMGTSDEVAEATGDLGEGGDELEAGDDDCDAGAAPNAVDVDDEQGALVVVAFDDEDEAEHSDGEAEEAVVIVAWLAGDSGAVPVPMLLELWLALLVAMLVEELLVDGVPIDGLRR
jgi:hypothetical protein